MGRLGTHAVSLAASDYRDVFSQFNPDVDMLLAPTTAIDNMRPVI